MSVESTRKVMKRYLEADHSDTSMMTDDVVFTIMATGDEHRTPEGVFGMLDYFYHVAFDATAEAKNMIFGEKNAIFEGDFVGRHIGEFAGIPATNKEVRVPLCVVYDLEDEKIKRGRVYFATPVFFQQVGYK